MNPVISQSDFLVLDPHHWMMKDLVAWWPMQEGAGETLFDVSPNRNNGVLTNMDQSTDWVTSSRGGGTLDFDGSNDRIDVAGITSLTLPFSVSLWFKIDNTANMRLFSLNAGGTGANAYSLYTGAGVINCQHYDVDNAVASTAISTGQWYHAVATFVSNSERSIYLDGELKGQTPITIQKVPARMHEITISREGYTEVRRSVEIKAGSSEQISVKLQKKGI